jgi:hypothetical protein
MPKLSRRALLGAPFAIAAARAIAAQTDPAPAVIPGSAQIPAAPPGYATLVIMRAPGMSGALWTYHFYVDKTLVAELRVHKYTVVFIPPGSHEVHTGATPDYRGMLLLLTAVAGETYYFYEDVTIISSGNFSKTVRFLEPEPAPNLKHFHYVKPIVQQLDGADHQAALVSASQ